MPNNYGPRIVTDGLVLCLDAGNTKSYSGSGTAWTDISRNGNSGTLTNGPTFNAANIGSIVFDGTNDYVSTNYTQPAYTTSSNFTWNIWVWPNGGNTLAPLLGDRGTNNDWVKLTIARMEYSDPGSGFGNPFGPQLANNVWSNACVVKNGTSFSYYLNGNLSASTTITVTKNTNPFYVGGDPTANEYSNSRIAQVLVYNKALSAVEILQNYNATKGRFKL